MKKSAYQKFRDGEIDYEELNRLEWKEAEERSSTPDNHYCMGYVKSQKNYNEIAAQRHFICKCGREYKLGTGFPNVWYDVKDGEPPI